MLMCSRRFLRWQWMRVPVSALAVLVLFSILLAGSISDLATAQAAHYRGEAPAAVPTPSWPNDGAVDHPVVSAGCGVSPPEAPGTTGEQSMSVDPRTNEGYATRTYWIHVSQQYVATQATALVLVFHGGGGTALGAEAATGFSPFADQHTMLVVYPQGLPFNALGNGYTGWAATGPFDSIVNGVDDMLFVSNLLDEIQRHYCVDMRRIYATGFSVGGAMTSFLTCGLTGRIAAYAPMSGDAYQFQGGCFPQHPTSIVEFHGAADPFELYAGVPAREDPDWRRIGVLEWLTTWANRDGCASIPTPFLQTAEVLGEQWAHCRDGEAIAHYRIAGLGHAWPPPIAGRNVLDIMWDFFQNHPLHLS
jgi:polyhydroxybutyrate depolymerase